MLGLGVGVGGLGFGVLLLEQASAMKENTHTSEKCYKNFVGTHP